MALANLFGGVDAFAVELGRHANVGDEYLRRGIGRPRDGALKVGRDPHHAQVLVAVNEGAHALSHDQIVVGEKDGDYPFTHFVAIAHGVNLPRRVGQKKGAGPHWGGGARTTPRNRATILFLI